MFFLCRQTQPGRNWTIRFICCVNYLRISRENLSCVCILALPVVIVGEEALSSADLFLLEASVEERGVKRHALFTDFLEGLDGGEWLGLGGVQMSVVS